jgi:hypothetical protein
MKTAHHNTRRHNPEDSGKPLTTVTAATELRSHHLATLTTSILTIHRLK